jgi:cytosine/adenosine deaminase-related metal-dependent hydrolase
MEFVPPRSPAEAIEAKAEHPAAVVIENCAIATMDGRRHDDSGAEHRGGHIVVSGGRITAVGDGPAPGGAADGARRVDGTGCLATPGLINTHHHLYQWLTQGRAACCG